MAPTDLDLTRTSVFLDFDGTISTRDVGLAPARAGRRRRVVAAARASTSAARSAAGSACTTSGRWSRATKPSCVRSRPRFRSTRVSPGSCTTCRNAGAEVTVVSDGFGFYVEEACAPLGVEVLTNSVDFTTRELRVPARGPLLPLLYAAACASRRRSRTRSTVDRPPCSSATARATARPRCSPTSCSRRTRSPRGASTFGVPALPVRDPRRRSPSPDRRLLAKPASAVRVIRVLLTPVRCRANGREPGIPARSERPVSGARRSSSASVLPSGSRKNAIHSSSPAVPN